MKLQNAYDTISDPTERRAYDLRWPGIRDSLWAQQDADKRQAEAAQAERKRAAEARAKKQEGDNARQERLRNLEQSRWRYDGEVFELRRNIRKLVTELKRLKDQDDEDVRKEREINGWWAYLTSPISGPVKETDEQKQERETNRINRLASKRIKESEMAEKEARLQRLQDALQDVNGRIADENKKVEDEKRRLEEEARVRKLKLEQEARDRAMREMRERRAKLQREQAERAAKEAREAQAAREAWEEQERARIAAAAVAAARRHREAEERVEAMRRAAKERVKATQRAAEEATKKSQRERSGLRTQSTCQHKGWWPKVEGRHLCAECHSMQNRFALQCPGCKMVACAGCQKNLRGERWKSHVGP